MSWHYAKKTNHKSSFNAPTSTVCCHVRSLASSETVPQCTDHASFSDIAIPQGSVVTHLRYGDIFNDCFIANFLECVQVKEFSKSVNIL